MQAEAKPAIIVRDNLLPEAGHRALAEFLRGPGWAFGAYSDEGPDASRYWYKHFAGLFSDPNENTAPDAVERQLDKAPGIAAMWRALKEQLLKGHRLNRCYANGYPYGSDGAVHRDADLPGHFTTLYYAHAEWQPNWGGETMFFDPASGEVLAAAYPKPNRLVIFPGTVPHVARGVSRACRELRITLMFKTVAPDAPPEWPQPTPSPRD